MSTDQVPYDAAGNMQVFPDKLTEWRPNTPFETALMVVGAERGRSAARYIAEDTKSGARYPLFMTDLLAIVQNGTIERGVIFGTWVGRKRGQNYGISLQIPS